MGSFSQGTVREKSESLARAAYPLLSAPFTDTLWFMPWAARSDSPAQPLYVEVGDTAQWLGYHAPARDSSSQMC